MKGLLVLVLVLPGWSVLDPWRCQLRGRAVAPASPAPGRPSRALAVGESRDFLEMAKRGKGL